MIFALCMTILLPSLAASEASPVFPPALVEFTPYQENPLFGGRGNGFWDESIRERGWILREDGTYYLWYTGYSSKGEDVKHLGLATSPDGITWKRYSDKPIYDADWVEDLMIVKQGGTYYMFAEGKNDHAHLLTSTDRVHWTEQGTLDIRYKDGSPLKPGPFGTPCAMFENDTWYLFYEREDAAIWLASSTDLKVWTNVQDEPVIPLGPGKYDDIMVALNQVVKYEGRYYAYYHSTGTTEGRYKWTMSVATSTDLLHWDKYPGNPIIGSDHSSGILVNDGEKYRMYCMHPDVCLYLPKGTAEKK